MSQAIDLARAPTLGSHLRRRPLPIDVLTVIRLAAGRPGDLAAASAATGRNAAFVAAAADLYIREVLCFAGADPYRTLGVTPGAPRAEIRQHMREFVLWLHPDRSGGDANAIMMRRVVEAWDAVSGSEAVPPPAVSAHPHGIRPYRPSWILRPVSRPERRSGWGRAMLRLAVLAACMLVPGFEPARLGDGLLRGVIGERAVAPTTGRHPRPTLAGWPVPKPLGRSGSFRAAVPT